MTDLPNSSQNLSEREITLALLSVLSEESGLMSLLTNITALMQRWSGCEAVGIRLKDGADYPYYVTKGFPAEFVLAENHLCDWHADGTPVCDEIGNPVLACMCGNVIEGRFDPTLPFFSKSGSFWSNGTTALLASTDETDRQSRTRNRCNGEGYESVALIPLRHGETRFGLLQFNDKNKDKFTAADIQMFERLAASLSIGLSQRMADKALREISSVWDASFNAMDEGLLVLDANHVIVQSNSSASRLLGIPRDKLLRTRWGEAVHGTDRPFPLCSLRKMKQSLTSESETFQFGDRWLEIKAEPMLNDAGKLDGAILIIQDISARKKSLESLELNRFYLAKAQEIGHIGTWELAIPNNILRWTDENYRIFGIPPGEPLTYERFLSCVHPEDRDLVNERWQAAVEGTTYDVEHRLLVNGSVKWVREKADITRDAQGRGRTAIGVTQDITERKVADEEREKLQAALLHAHKMESVGRLAGGVAHDFNNMLGVILGHVETALEQVSPDTPLFDHLNEIQNAGQRSAELTRQLLAFARKQTVAPKVLDMNEIVAGMLKLLLRLIGEDIHLEWRPSSNLWPVKIDPTQIEQILANLCVNARDAIQGVGKVTLVTRNVSLDAARFAGHADPISGSYVLLSVSDDGCGMDKNTLEHLFEPFYTTKGLGEGTGLGLATVYGIVDQNRGIVTVDSTPGRGSTFEIYLPRDSGKIAEEYTESKTKLAPKVRKTILLVEDESALLRLAQKLLENAGYRVLAAQTPQDAIRVASEHEGAVDLLLTDVIMPEMNGRDLAAKLIETHPHLKCLFMSGYPADAMTDRGILELKATFLQKPFLKQDLYDAVLTALDNQRI